MIKYILIILVLSSLVGLKNESLNNNSCTDCKVFLSSIGGLDIAIGDEKDKVLKLFKNVNLFEHVSDKENEYYNVNQSVVLPNKKSSSFFGTLAFDADRLIYIHMSLPIGKNYKYYEELISILEKNDTLQVNKFVYKNKKNVNVERNQICYKIFGFKRSSKNPSEFEINLKYTENKDVAKKR